MMFEKRVLAERSAQIEEELTALDKLLISLKNQISTAEETLAMANARQGKTSVEINQISSNLMSLYRLEAEKINAESQIEKLRTNLSTLYEQWPMRLSYISSAVEKP